MNARRDGFTLIEMMIVAVLLAVVLGSVYQALNVQEMSYRTGSAVIRGQESMRTALGILESELREVSTTQANIGGADIRAAAPDSVVFRAQRKLGFVCATSPGDNKVTLAVMGDAFVGGSHPDSVLIFVDGDSLRSDDDAWIASNVVDASSDASTACATRFPGLPVQTVHVGPGALANVRLFSPVRSFEWVMYGIRQFAAPRGWGLGRRFAGADSVDFLVGGLAPPPDGLRFDYYDAAGNATSVPDQITRMRIRTQILGNDPAVDPQSLTTNLFFRSN